MSLHVHTQQAPAIRWKAKDASEARLYVRQMHRRIPAWKLKLCTEALNARPIDLVRIIEGTEIQFVTEDLVDVAAQCLTDIAKEIESMNHTVGDIGAATAVPDQNEQVSAGAESAPSESKERSETAAEEPTTQTGEDDSSKQTGDQ